MRRFQKIDVKEPTVEDSIEILKGLKPYFEEYHKLKYTNEAIKAAVELSAKYINDRKLPDKAIDVIDETGASQMLVPEGKRKKKITVKEVEATVATMARIPPKTITKSRRRGAGAISSKDLKRLVFGQDKAIEALARAPSSSSRAGLREPEKPIGCYLFSGPTGVGKTEVAKQLADLMGVELLRFDMSEYMEKHTVSRLIGAPPGYVGFDQGGLLTDGIDQHPHSRAAARRDREGASGPVQHPAAGDGSRQAHRPQRQVGRLPQRHPDHDHQCRRLRSGQAADRLRPRASARATTRKRSTGMFTPEFRNRLDAVIPFAGPAAGGHHARSSRSSCSSSRRSLPTAASRSSSREEAAQVAGGEGLRREVRRPAAGARHPGAHQEAARRRAAVRQAGARRHVKVLVDGEGEDRKLAFEYLAPEPNQAAEGAEERGRRRRRRRDARTVALVEAAPRKALPGPKEKKERPPRARHRAQRAAPQGRVAPHACNEKAPELVSGAFFFCCLAGVAAACRPDALASLKSALASPMSF